MRDGTSVCDRFLASAFLLIAGVVSVEITLVAVAQPVVVPPASAPIGRVVPGLQLAGELSGAVRTVRESPRATRTVEATAQNDAHRLAFDVVSIKRNLMLDAPTAVAQVRTIRNRVIAPSATLRDLVRAAYNYQFRPVSLIIGGPAWVDTERYEVVGLASTNFAPPPGRGLLPEAANEMLRTMLADRFQLKMHVEMRERNVFELVLDRPDGQLGPTLTRAKGDCQSSMGTPDPTIRVPPCPFFLRWDPDGTTIYEMRNITLSELASTIGNYPSIDELVVDRTGLTGRFDIKVTSYEPRPQLTAPAARELPPPTDIAIRQQLGLRLRRARLPVESIVIDSVSRPSGN